MNMAHPFSKLHDVDEEDGDATADEADLTQDEDEREGGTMNAETEPDVPTRPQTPCEPTEQPVPPLAKLVSTDVQIQPGKLSPRRSCCQRIHAVCRILSRILLAIVLLFAVASIFQCISTDFMCTVCFDMRHPLCALFVSVVVLCVFVSSS
jgi:hypothetical protein